MTEHRDNNMGPEWVGKRESAYRACYDQILLGLARSGQVLSVITSMDELNTQAEAVERRFLTVFESITAEAESWCGSSVLIRRSER